MGPHRRFGTGLTLVLVAFGCGRAPEEPSVEMPVAAVREAPRDPSRESKPVCALLDFGKTTQGALLELKLLPDPAATWVERANIEAVLKEQQLQAAFGPQGVSDRVKLGKLLKADLLVMVRPVKDAKEPAIEVVVSETAGGLRLLVRGVATTKDSDADVHALAEAVKEGLKKHGERIREVVAVPPFVSNDFAYTFDHLKGTFAKLAEGEALNRPGVVVVELEEAEALARELALAGSKLDRPLPLYLLGEYRNEGKGADRTVSLKLRAERGGKAVGGESSQAVKADAAPAAVRAWAASTLDGLAKDGPRAPSDPKAEAKQLAARGNVFNRLGNWEEAAALYEASLLLDPDQQDLRISTIEAIGWILRSKWPLACDGTLPFEPVAQLCRLAVSHLEAYVLRGGDLMRNSAPGQLTFWSLFQAKCNGFVSPGPASEAALKGLKQLHGDNREVLLRLLEPLAKRGKLEEGAILHPIMWHLPREERFVLARRLVIELKNDERALDRAKLLLASAWGQDASREQFLGFLESFAADKDPVLREASRLLTQQFHSAPNTPLTTDADKPHFDPKLVKLTPIPLDQKPMHGLSGLLSCGPGVDVLWTSHSVFLMKERGRLIPVREAANGNSRIANVVYDGRYVWASTCESTVVGEAPVDAKLILIDPTAPARTRVFDSKDGLPATEAGPGGVPVARLFVAALAPGKVALAWGQVRAWIGTASLRPDGGSLEVRRLLEAPEAQVYSDHEQWKRIRTTFSPSYAIAFGSGTNRHVLFGRGGEGTLNSELRQYPLLVDPDRGTAELSLRHRQTGDYAEQWKFVADGDSTLGFEQVSATEYQLHRFSASPNVSKRVVASNLPTDIHRVVAHGSRIHFTTEHRNSVASRITGLRRWWTIDPATQRFWLSADNLPEIQSLAVSSHFGLVAITGGRDSRGVSVTELQSVEVGNPKPETIRDGRDRPRGTLHPEEGKGLKSVGSGNPVNLVVKNTGAKPIRLHWIDFEGKRKFYAEIAPGKQFTQATFATHVWLVADADDNVWRIIRPGSKSEPFEIIGPEKP